MLRIVIACAAFWLALVAWMVSADAHELECLALNVYHEARGESELGQSAVAWVTINRTQSSRFPDTICAVVHQHKQFSWYSDGRSDRASGRPWGVAVRIAQSALQGLSPDPTYGALWYHSDAVRPSWAAKLPKGPVIGRHVFYGGGYDREALVAMIERVK